jgi:hypothetical protein
MAKKTTTTKKTPSQNPISNSNPTNGLISPTTNGEDKMEAAAASSTVAAANPPIKTTKKPELVASQTRANLVPINLDDEIRQLAYQLSERRGFQPGHETEDWLSAEREVRQRYKHMSASA